MILCVTALDGDPEGLGAFLRTARGTAGTWFDWMVVAGGPGPRTMGLLEGALHDPEKRGIQHLVVWPEYRGRHHVLEVALGLARERRYRWLLWLDRRAIFRTKRWLKKMVERGKAISDAAGGPFLNVAVEPRVANLFPRPDSLGEIRLGLDFPAQEVPEIRGPCRMYPMDLVAGYRPDPGAPMEAGDEEALSEHVRRQGGICVRLPSVRMRVGEGYGKGMGAYWPWIDPRQ